MAQKKSPVESAISSQLQEETEAVKLKLLKLELKEQEQSGKRGLIAVGPVWASILIALIGFLGTLIAKYSADREKDLKEREFEYKLIEKALEQPTPEGRLMLLKFDLKLGIIKNENIVDSLRRILGEIENPPPRLPVLPDKGDSAQINDSNVYRSLSRNATMALIAAQKALNTVDSLQRPAFNIGSVKNNGSFQCSFISWCYSQSGAEKQMLVNTSDFSRLIKDLRYKKFYRNSSQGIKRGDIYFIKDQSNNVKSGGIVETTDANEIIALHANNKNRGLPVFREHIKIRMIAGYGRVE